MSFMVTLLFFIPPSTFSQEENCLSKLKKAQELFDSGLIEEIPSMLEECLKDGFNKEQNIQAYHLLIQVYLFDYNQKKAENTMLELLSLYPEYEVYSNDPIEFINLFNQFKTIPKFSISINPGISISDISLLERFSTGNLNNLKSEYRPDGINIGVRLSFEKYFTSKAWFTIGAAYSYSGYKVTENMNFDRELLTFSEKMQYVYIPHYFNYSFIQYKRISPYILAGGQFGYLIKSTGEIDKKSLVENTNSSISSDITKSRYAVNYSVIAGIGIRYKIPTGYLRANVYYTLGLTDYIKETSRFSDSESLFNYHIDDNIKLNFFNFTLGYSYIFYKTSKKTLTEDSNLP